MKTQAKYSADIVSASEIAAFEWCPESWRLEKGLHLKPGNERALKAGDKLHEEKVSFEKRAGSAISVGFRLLLLGLFFAALAGVFLWAS